MNYLYSNCSKIYCHNLDYDKLFIYKKIYVSIHKYYTWTYWDRIVRKEMVFIMMIKLIEQNIKLK